MNDHERKKHCLTSQVPSAGVFSPFPMLHWNSPILFVIACQAIQLYNIDVVS